MTTFLSIDPGKKGAICIMDADVNALPSGVWHDLVPKFIDMPLMEEPYKKEMIDVVDHRALADIISRYALDPDVEFILEHLWGFGAAANGKEIGQWTMARDYGAIIGIFRALRLEYILCAPQSWQSGIGLPKGTSKEERKAAIAQIVKRKVPQANLIKPGCRTVADGRSDALAIGIYRIYRRYMEQFGGERKRNKRR